MKIATKIRSSRVSNIREDRSASRLPDFEVRNLPEKRLGLAFSKSLTDWLLLRPEYPLVIFVGWVGFLSYELSSVLIPLPQFASFHSGTPSCLACGLGFSLLAKGLNAYHKECRFESRENISRMILAAVLWMYPAGLIMRSVNAGILGSVLNAVVLILACRFARAFLQKNPKRFVMVGPDTQASREILEATSKNGRGVLAYYRSVDPDEMEDPSLISALVVTIKGASDPVVLQRIIGAVDSGCDITDDVSHYEDLFGRLPPAVESSAWVCSFGLRSQRIATETWQRLLDIIVASIGVVLSAPLFLLICILIKLHDFGPVFFIQERQGRFNRPFQLFKFRTMKETDPNQPLPFTSGRDSRVTWIGRILRHFHLDELPQLLNILRGEMSIVGPRPEMTYFARAMSERIPVYDLRYLVRPGLTGWAQINQGYAMDDTHSTLRKLSYDFYYLKNRSIWFDISIILRTAFFTLNDTHYRKLVRDSGSANTAPQTSAPQTTKSKSVSEMGQVATAEKVA